MPEADARTYAGVCSGCIMALGAAWSVRWPEGGCNVAAFGAGGLALPAHPADLTVCCPCCLSACPPTCLPANLPACLQPRLVWCTLRHQPRPTSTWCSCLMRWRTSEWAWLGVACIAWIKMEQPARQPASNSAGQAAPAACMVMLPAAAPHALSAAPLARRLPIHSLQAAQGRGAAAADGRHPAERAGSPRAQEGRLLLSSQPATARIGTQCP